MYEKFEKIKGVSADFLDIRDLSTILESELESTRVIAGRMVKKRILKRLKKDLYVLSDREINPFRIGNRLLSPSYISFESALNYWGMTTQIPTSISSASLRSKRYVIGDIEYTYSKLPQRLFNFGFKIEKGFYIASPEKVLLDMAYYTSLGRRSLNFDELYLNKINWAELRGFLKKKYSPEVKDIIKKLQGK